MKNKLFSILVFAAVTIICLPVVAQGGGSGDWEFMIAPYAWIAGVNADQTVRGTNVSTEKDFPDILDSLDFAAMLHFEARKNKWALFSDIIYLDLSNDAEVGPVKVDMGIKGALVELGGMYRIVHRPVGKNKERSLALDLLAGGRYVSMEGEIDFRNLPTIDRSKNWIDPIVGGRLIADISDKFTFSGRLDIGGFGIGDGSDFTWNLLAALGYDLSKSTTLWLGYRALDINYDTGSGGNLTEFDLTISGPLVGVGFRF